MQLEHLDMSFAGHTFSVLVLPEDFKASLRKTGILEFRHAYTDKYHPQTTRMVSDFEIQIYQKGLYGIVQSATVLSKARRHFYLFNAGD